MTREQWLANVATKLETLFVESGYRVPNYLVTCNDQDLSRTRQAYEIIMSLHIGDSMRAADILAHEMAHAVVGLEQGHTASFKHCVAAIGLEGDVSATIAGEAFRRRVQPWLDELGSYPGTGLNPLGRPLKLVPAVS